MQMSRCFQSEGFQFFALLHSAQHLLPAPSLQSPARHSPPFAHSQRFPGPSIKCRSQAAQGAAVSGFSVLLASLCTALAGAEKCPPGHWLLRDLGRTHRGNTLRSSLPLFSKINFKNLFTFPQYNKQSNKVYREVLLALCPFLHLSPCQLRNCFH